MTVKTLLFVRPGESGQEVKSTNPLLSDCGRCQAGELARQISKSDIGGIIDIYFCTSRTAEETAYMIKERLLSSGKKVRRYEAHEELLTNAIKNVDELWLKNEIETSNIETLIIVGHIDLVRWFPAQIGYKKNEARAGEGVLLRSGVSVDIKNNT